MGRAYRLLGKSLKEKLSGKSLNFAKEHYQILMQLGFQDGKHQQEIANCIYKDKGTIARAINRLEKENLIERRPSHQDKRQKLLYLTEEGKALVEEFPPMTKGIEKQALKGLDKNQIKAFKDTLITIYENLK